MFKVVSLFCGGGGADLGAVGGFSFNNYYYAKNPCKLVWAGDINEKAIETHSLNFSCDNLVCGDIADIDSNTIPDHDILVGGFPCQSFSTVNPTKDPFDDRANLYKQMVRIAKEKQPQIFIAENVKGFMTLHKGAIFSRAIKEFEKAGFKTYTQLINACDYGVPQKRERVFIVGVRKNIERPFVFPQKTHENNWVPLSAAVPSLAIDEQKYYFSKRAVQGMKNAKNNMKRGLAQDLNEPCLTITSHLAKVSLNSRDPVLLVDPATELYRRFTPREAARIQSFPDEFKFGGSESEAYRQIGNAIPPILFWHIIRAVIEHLS